MTRCPKCNLGGMTVSEAELAKAIQREVIERMPDPQPGGLSIAQAAARVTLAMLRGER